MNTPDQAENENNPAQINRVLKPWWLLIFGIVGGLLGAGILLLVSRPPRGEPVLLLPLPGPASLVVHVNGAVNHPGVYTLPAGSRVGEAIEAAGGFSQQADEGSVNLAMRLEDGMQVSVAEASAGRELPVRSTSANPGLININTATQAELESLPEIGEVTAQAILAYRDEHGPFERIEDLLDVPGIGSLTFAAIRDLVTVGALP